MDESVLSSWAGKTKMTADLIDARSARLMRALLDLVLEKNPGSRISRYQFRAVSPLFDTAPFLITGRRTEASAELWAQNPEGCLAMNAQVDFA